MDIRMITCEPDKAPEDRKMSSSADEITKFLNGWFEVAGIGKRLLLYRHEYPRGLPFNRMVRGKPVFGNFMISKLGDGKLTDLNDQEVVDLIAELIVPKSNSYN